MATRAIMPKQGLQMTEGTIIKWLVKEGGAVEEGKPLFEMETDKLSIEIDSPATGNLLKIVKGEGEVVPITETIGIIGRPGEDITGMLSKPVDSQPENNQAAPQPEAAKDSYDLTVIGGGPGGYEAAIRALQLGLKVAVVEEREMGGTCLNRGCIPTKALLHSAEVYRSAKTCAEFGVFAKDVEFDFGKIAARKDKIVKQLRMGVEQMVKGSGGEIFNGRATVKSRNSIEISGSTQQVIKTDKILIATGSRPAKPPIPGIDGRNVLDSDGVLSLKSCPDSIVIIGGGVIGVEFATIFNSLGKKVTVLEMMDQILPGTDAEISALMRKTLESRGISIVTGSKVVSIQSDKAVLCTFETDGKERQAEGEIVVVAIGRKPNSAGLGLENIGVETERGFIKTDDRMETSVPGVYAIGDVTGKVQLAHVASAQGMVAAANAAGGKAIMDYSVIPGCIYTDPEIATVGLTEADAVKKGLAVKIGRFPVGMNGKSMVMGQRDGLIKIITDAKTGEILGVHMMGPRATDMIAEMCVAMKLESTVEEVAETIHPHPTVSEIMMEAANDALGICVNKPGKPRR